MNANMHAAPAVPCRTPRGLLIAGVLLATLIGAVGGCQGRGSARPEPARFMADSLVEANRALYDSTGPQLGYARINCLYARAWSLLGREQAGQVVREAEETVRARHSPSEVAAVNQGLQGNYPTPTPEVCKGVDSSWYARAGAHSAVRPKP